MAVATTTVLAIAAAVAVAASAAGSVMSLQANKESAEASMKASAEQSKLNSAEDRRQQLEVNKQAHEEKSDVIRKAEADLGTLRAVSGGMGASGASFTRLLMDIAGSEGRDITRVERNRQAHIDALQADAEAGVVNARNQVRATRDEANQRRKQTYVSLASKAVSAAPTIAGGFGGGGESYGGTGQGLMIQDNKTGMLGGGV